MGLIGIRIRIAHKDKMVSEFKLNEKIIQKEQTDEVKTDEVKTDEVKTDEVKTETEQIQIDSEKIKKIETMEEEEAELK